MHSKVDKYYWLPIPIKPVEPVLLPGNAVEVQCGGVCGQEATASLMTESLQQAFRKPKSKLVAGCLAGVCSPPSNIYHSRPVHTIPHCKPDSGLDVH